MWRQASTSLGQKNVPAFYPQRQRVLTKPSAPRAFQDVPVQDPGNGIDEPSGGPDGGEKTDPAF